ATGKDLGASHLKLPPDPGSPTIISPDGRFGVTVARFRTPAVARAAESREAVLFDTASGEVLSQIALEVEVSPVHRKPILFSPDSKSLAVSLGNDENAKERIAFYEVPSGKLLRTLNVSPPEAAPAAPLGKAKGKGKAPKGGGAGPGGAAPGGAA